MHLSAAPRRRPVHIFSNHTPRPFEVQDPGPTCDSHARPPEMLGPTGMVLGPILVPSACAPPAAQTRSKRAVPASDSSAGVHHPGSGLVSAGGGGGAPSLATQRAHTTTPASSCCDESNTTSDEFPATAATAAAQGAECRELPFLDKMMTQTNLLVLPPSNPSYQMAYFLKTTGPVGERAQKPAKGKRISSAMRLFKSNGRRPSGSLTAAHQRSNDVISEEELHEPAPPAPEPKLPEGVTQKISKTGKKYFQIEQTQPEQPAAEPTPPQSPDILDSRVSVFVDDHTSAENLSNWILTLSGHDQVDEVPARGRALSTAKTSAERTVRILDLHDETPVRPPASSPATPALDSGVDCVAHDMEDLHDKIAPLRSHPILTDIPSIPPALLQPKRVASDRRAPLKAPQLAHPSPRRMGSHSLLLQRATSDATGMRWSRDNPDLVAEISVSGNPGPPPPRSPLRLQSYSQPIESVLARPRERHERPAPDNRPDSKMDRYPKVTEPVEQEAEITALPQFNTDVVHIADLRRRSVSRCTSVASNDIFNPAKIKSKYSKHSNKPLSLIDSTVKPPQTETPRRRLKRARPEGPRPLDLSKPRSNASLTHVSGASCAGTLPMKRSVPLTDLCENVRAVPTTQGSSPKIGYVRRPTNAFLRGRRSPAPRPRSAKVMRQQARSSACSTRSPSPAKHVRLQETPVLPSPPPKKELPPTPTKKDHRIPQPTVSRASIDAALARACSTKALPSPPVGRRGQSFVFPSPPSSTISPRRPLVIERGEPSPQSTDFSSSVKEERPVSGLEARLAAIERRNRLLEAALMAVLKTSGTLNGCPCGVDSAEHAAHHGAHHKAQCSVASGLSSTSSGRDVLDVFKETKVRY